MNKRVLIITYYWPPCGGSGVQRWVKFAKYLPAEGWQPVIYTPSNPEYQGVDSTLEAEIPPEAEVLRRPIFEPYGLYRKLFGKRSNTDMKELTAPSQSGVSHSWKDRMGLWVRSNFFVPDPRVWWVRPSVRYLKAYLKEHPVDVIVTTGPPHSMHLIGEWLHRDTGIPWISDWRDPWTKMYWFKRMPFSPRAARMHRELEQRVLDASSVVLTVSPLVRDFYAAQTATPVEMITNGFDEEDFLQTVEPDGYFNLTHTGIFPADGNPERLWAVLSKMCEREEGFRQALRIRLCGRTDAAVLSSLRAAGLWENVVDLGYRDHAASVREQLGASVLLLPLRDDPDYRLILPGKVFEYLAAGRPLLGIGSPDGAMARLLAETPSSQGNVHEDPSTEALAPARTVCAFDDEEALRAFIEGAWQQFLAAKNAHQSPSTIDSSPARDETVAAFSRRALTHRLSALLDSLLLQ